VLRSDDHLLDLGVILFSHGFRCGIFGSRSLDDLFDAIEQVAVSRLSCRVGRADKVESCESLCIFRRGFARMMAILFGPEVARYFMGHAVGSLVLEKFYLLSPVEMEVLRGFFQGDERGAGVEEVSYPLSSMDFANG
jgi:hypothetical protein